MTEKFNLWERGRPFTSDSVLSEASVKHIAADIKRSLESFLQRPEFAVEFGSPLGEIVGTSSHSVGLHVVSAVLEAARRGITERTLFLYTLADGTHVLTNSYDYHALRTEPDLADLTADHTHNWSVVTVTLKYKGKPIRVELDAQ